MTKLQINRKIVELKNKFSDNPKSYDYKIIGAIEKYLDSDEDELFYLFVYRKTMITMLFDIFALTNKRIHILNVDPNFFEKGIVLNHEKFSFTEIKDGKILKNVWNFLSTGYPTALGRKHIPKKLLINFNSGNKYKALIECNYTEIENQMENVEKIKDFLLLSNKNN